MTVVRRELRQAICDTAAHRCAFSFQAAGILALWIFLAFWETRVFFLVPQYRTARCAVFSACGCFLLFPLLAGWMRGIATGVRGEGFFWFSKASRLFGAALVAVAISVEFLFLNGIGYAAVAVAGQIGDSRLAAGARVVCILLWIVCGCLTVLRRLSALAAACAAPSLPRAYFYHRRRPLPIFCCLRVFLQGLILAGSSLFLPILPRNCVTFCALLVLSSPGSASDISAGGDTLEFDPVAEREISKKIAKTLDKAESV